MRENLQIELYMQSTDDTASKGHDVIDIVTNAGRFSESHGLSVEGIDYCSVGPRHRCADFGGVPASDVRNQFVVVLASPFLEIILASLLISVAPLFPGSLFLVFVLFVPGRICARVLSPPSYKPGADARLTGIRQSVRRRLPKVEERDGFSGATGPTAFKPEPGQRGLFSAFVSPSGGESWSSCGRRTGPTYGGDSVAAPCLPLPRCSVRFVEVAQWFRAVASGTGLCLHRLFRRRFTRPAALLTVFDGSLGFGWTCSALTSESTFSSQRHGVRVLARHRHIVTYSGAGYKEEMASA